MLHITRRPNRFQTLRNDLPYPFAARVDEETLSNEHIAWFTIYLLFVLNDREGIRLSRAAMQALALQPLPLPLPFPNFGRHHQSLVDVIEKHRSLFSVQTESDFLEQPITLERAFFGFVRNLYLDPYEEFQTRFLNRGWNAFFARRTMKTNFQDEQDGPLSYFGQILDRPVASAYSSTERLKELAFTYPFPNVFAPAFMHGRGAGFLTGLVTPAGARLGLHSTQQSLARRQFHTEAPSVRTFQRHNQPNTYATTRNRPISAYIPLRDRTIPPFATLTGTYPSPPRNIPLAMIPMTRSRRRDQQVLAQTGYGPSVPRTMQYLTQRSTPQNESEHIAPSHPYRSLHRRTRQRNPIPDHMRGATDSAEGSNSETLASETNNRTWIRPTSTEESSRHTRTLQPVNITSQGSPLGIEDESMIIVRVERDGQSARVLVDSHDEARRGRRVPSLQQDLGGIMDPDECTICKGSWSWIKGDMSGEPKTSPADWRLVRLPCKHTYHEECLARCLYAASSCPTCRREYTSTQWMDRMVELGRKVNASEQTETSQVSAESVSPSEPSASEREREPHTGAFFDFGEGSQRGVSTRTSSSATAVTVIRQPEESQDDPESDDQETSQTEQSGLELAPIQTTVPSSRTSSLSTLSGSGERSENLYRMAGIDLNLPSTSTDSLDSFTYDVFTAMQILSLAEHLDAETENIPERITTLSDLEDSHVQEDTIVLETPVDRTPADGAHTPAVTSQGVLDDLVSSTLPDGGPSFERASSRASISSTTSRIPRLTLSRMSMSTNDDVISRPAPIYRTAARTLPTAGTRSHSSVPQNMITPPGTQALREHILRSNTRSRLPLPFSTDRMGPHAHPERAITGLSSYRTSRSTTRTPDSSFGFENFSRQSDRPSSLRESGTSTPGFLRATRSSEAKASPQSPVKTVRPKVVTPSKPPGKKPSWR